MLNLDFNPFPETSRKIIYSNIGLKRNSNYKKNDHITSIDDSYNTK